MMFCCGGKRSKTYVIPEGSDFKLFFENKYETDLTNYKEKELYPNKDSLNNDFCLVYLHDQKG